MVINNKRDNTCYIMTVVIAMQYTTKNKRMHLFFFQLGHNSKIDTEEMRVEQKGKGQTRKE